MSAQLDQRPFGAKVRDALIARELVTAMGNPNWSAFALELDGVQYESLRKAVTGERRPSPKIMEEVASALDMEPGDFIEYRLWLAQRAFDPAEVGEDEAFANLQAWIKTKR